MSLEVCKDMETPYQFGSVQMGTVVEDIARHTHQNLRRQIVVTACCPFASKNGEHPLKMANVLSVSLSTRSTRATLKGCLGSLAALSVAVRRRQIGIIQQGEILSLQKDLQAK